MTNPGNECPGSGANPDKSHGKGRPVFCSREFCQCRHGRAQRVSNPHHPGSGGYWQASRSIYLAAKRYSWILVITSDHGNFDEMIDLETGEPNTGNPVPCLIVSALGAGGFMRLSLLTGMQLAALHRPFWTLMGIDVPTEKEAPSLVLNTMCYVNAANKAVMSGKPQAFSR